MIISKKELQLQQILDLKLRTVEARYQKACARQAELEAALHQLHERRNAQPSDPRDQIYHERHLGWLDARARQIAIQAAQAAVEVSESKEMMRREFGRKTAFGKATAARAEQKALELRRQLS